MDRRIRLAQKKLLPGKWPNRFRDSWERCLQFNKTRDFKMFQDRVRVPMGKWADTRLKSLGKNDVVRFESSVQSGFGKRIANWVGRELAYPTNVLHMPTETGNKRHSAAFPEELPAWFIKLFTAPGDTVLDPFLGSGTTAVAALRLGRAAVGIELRSEYISLARKRITKLDLKAKRDNTIVTLREDALHAPHQKGMKRAS